MGSKKIVETLSEKEKDILNGYVERGRIAVKNSDEKTRMFYRAHVYGFVDALVCSGRYTQSQGRMLRIYYVDLIG